MPNTREKDIESEFMLRIFTDRRKPKFSKGIKSSSGLSEKSMKQLRNYLIKNSYF